MMKIPLYKSIARLFAIFGVLFSSVAAYAETCDGLFGKFRVSSAPWGPGVIELAREILDPEYQLGQPAIELYREGTSAWRHGLISNTRAEIEIREDSSIFGAHCEARLGQDVSIVMFDFSRLNPREANGLIDWLEKIWEKRPTAEQLQGVHYLLAQDIRMIGVMDISLLTPLERYE
jgi:hypothetical protein